MTKRFFILSLVLMGWCGEKARGAEGRTGNGRQFEDRIGCQTHVGIIRQSDGAGTNRQKEPRV